MSKKTNLRDLGEAGIIRLIQEGQSSDLPPRIKRGIGDDCAVLETTGDRVLLVTTDTLIEGIHFTGQTLSPEALGWKALAVNISDIAAMGGTPRTAFLSIGMKTDTEASFIESFMSGFRLLAKKTDVMLAGGDTVESPVSTVITVTLLGDCRPEHVVYRSGAMVGDDLWVTGPLGNAAAGLFLLQNKRDDSPAGYESLVRAHQKPMPPIELGIALGESAMAHAMIDISDGVAKDLGHICEQSAVGAVVQGVSIPMSSNLIRLAAEADTSPLQWALHGGEDYELLFTASPVDRKEIESLTVKVSSAPATRIGTITGEDGIWLERGKGKEPFRPGGYVHFSR
ncbi:MAG: thiamine-phosphate kinase [Desulfobacterales bacterium S3730MH5]|nr:MAG: thiamine-phosphate kinase [Desulfobacterales bacterium S3730MH5]